MTHYCCCRLLPVSVGKTVEQVKADMQKGGHSSVAGLSSTPIAIGVEAVETDDETVSSTMAIANGSTASGDPALVPQGWMPIYFVSKWLDKNFRNRITLVICLPAGVNAQDFEVRVGDNSKEIELKVSWPALLTDTKFIAKVQKKIGGKKLQEAKFVGMSKRVADMRSCLTGSNDLNSVCRIPLPAEVETVADLFPIGRKSDGTRILTIDLVEKGEYAGKVVAKSKDFVELDNDNEPYEYDCEERE